VTKGRHRAAGLLLAAALGLVSLGQYYFFHRREYLWDGVVFHALAVLCFVLAWRLATAQTRTARPPRRWSLGLEAWLRTHPVPAALVALGLLFSGIATLLVRDRIISQSTADAVLLWLLGIGAAGTATLWPTAWPPAWVRDGRARLRGISRGTWLEVATVVALTALAFLLRATALGSVPFTLGGDEAWHGLLARQVLHGELRNPFVMGYMSMPTLFYWPLSWSLRLAGDTMVGARLPAALVGTATVPLLYLFARSLWPRRMAFLAAAFLAAYDYHIHFSRLVANNVWDPLFVLLTLWALDRGIGKLGLSKAEGSGNRDSGTAYRLFLAAGLVMGLSFYFYTGARLLPALIVVYVGFVAWRRRGRIEGLGRHLLLLALAFLVVAGPMLSYALSHPNEWNARINQVGILQSGWLAREPGLTGKSTLYILAEQFLRAAGAFHVFPDRTVWYGADRPLLGFLAGAFALLGLAWAIAHWRERRHFLVLIWFWSAIIAGGMLTESPPSSQRLVIAIPAVALLVATGLEQTVVLAARLFLPKHQRWENVILGLLIVLLAASSVRFYFLEFSLSRRYGSANGETATMIGHYLHDLDDDYRAYFFGAPRIYWNFGTMPFLAPDVPGEDVSEPLSAPPDFVDADHAAVFVFLPDRAGELAWVQQAFPDGCQREFYDGTGQLRFIAYEVQP
jgi:4-amino-4-deoxy-L-arabinose transferase-like glycosyltransferase